MNCSASVFRQFLEHWSARRRPASASSCILAYGAAHSMVVVMQGVRSQCRGQLATAIVLFALLGACGRNSGAHKSSAESETSGTAATAGATVSRIGDRVITSAELDRSVQLPLHDVDMQKYGCGDKRSKPPMP